MSHEMRSARFERPTVGRGAIGGAIGGLVGALIFGGVLWMGSPDVLEESITSFYMLEHSLAVGWGLHLLHGLILGVLFGVVASRKPVFDMITASVETDILKGLSANTRFALLGVVYGIAIWTMLPFIGLSLLGTVDAFRDPEFSGLAVDMILGHVVFGIIVGLGFSTFVPTRTRPLEL